MLAPNSKRAALSPRTAKSPEEVEMYASGGHPPPPSSHVNTMYRTPVSNAYANSSAYRLHESNAQPPMSIAQYPTTNIYDLTSSQQKVSQHQQMMANPPPSKGPSGQPHQSNMSLNQSVGYRQHRAFPMHNFPQNTPVGRSFSADCSDELVSNV